MSRATSELYFIGVPFNCDGTPPEVEHPPQHLRRAGLLKRLGRSRHIRDWGDLSIPVAEGIRDEATNVLNWRSWQAVTERLARTIGESLSAGGWPLVVGGDCSILVGIIAGVAEVQVRCGLFFVDGHGDFLTPSTSPTGEPADMELAALTGRAPSPLAVSGGSLLRDEDIVVYGIRESDGIEDAPIRVVDYLQLCAGQLAATVRECANSLSAELPVWLHFDVDVIDADLMPVIYPAGAGLTYGQTAALLHTLLSGGCVIGMDVACFHPNLDRSGAATACLADLLVDVLEG
jgi:arginase